MELTIPSRIGLPVYSKLRELVASSPMAAAPGPDWGRWLSGQVRRGLSEAELAFSGVMGQLEELPQRVTRAEVLLLLQRLPSDVVVSIRRQAVNAEVEFVAVNEPRSDLRQLHPAASRHDPVPVITDRNVAFGFNIARFWCQDLLGYHDIWRVVDRAGKPWRSRRLLSCRAPQFRTREDALQWCRFTARYIIPLQRGGFRDETWFRKERLKGGERYQEWLVTLPHFVFNPLWRGGRHFKCPNLLMHLRTSVQVVGERRLLLIEEIQSDYNQEISFVERTVHTVIHDNPFQKHWVELGLRIGALLVGRLGLDGLATSTGAMHDIIYLDDEPGRARFYDVQVAKALAKLSRGLGAQSGQADIGFVTQHYEAVSEEFTGLQGDTRKVWRLHHRWAGDVVARAFDSEAEAIAYRDRMVERHVVATVPVMWMSGKLASRIYRSGLPALGAIEPCPVP